MEIDKHTIICKKGGIQMKNKKILTVICIIVILVIIALIYIAINKTNSDDNDVNTLNTENTLSTEPNIPEDKSLTFNVKVTNVGDYAAKDAVQLYVSSPYTQYDIDHHPAVLFLHYK